MLGSIFNIMTPELITNTIRSNPNIVIDMMRKFETFDIVGKALTVEQQILVSNNCSCINEFLKTTTGKESMLLMIDEFTKFIENKHKEVLSDLKLKV